ncbi:MAG: diguanylate cyclase, partial [Gammaproteobacteria bacterium]|nr:diguanylate cyclase [Gammaproteobacteria bacterium]
DASLVANNILKTVPRPVELQEQIITPSTSIGISIYPSDAESANGLQNAADNAMYGAKASGNNSYQYFSNLS